MGDEATTGGGEKGRVSGPEHILLTNKLNNGSCYKSSECKGDVKNAQGCETNVCMHLCLDVLNEK